MPDRVGQQIGNYVLLRLLGRGGFAEVYLGQHIRLDMQAAIKVLRLSLSDDEVEKFQREAKIIAGLQHPHIVRVLDFDVQQEVPFLVMDYAPNGSLRDHYPKGQSIALPMVVSYVRQVAQALQYAHDRKVIHRDVKPENMLLRGDGEILLSDFGIAAVSHTTGSLVLQGIAGTPPYMAPEQFQQKPRPASDQYALGIVAYEWLCGMHPFQGSIWELMQQHIQAPPPPLREKMPSLLPEVEQAVLKALAKDPKERFESVQSFAIALEQASKNSVPSNASQYKAAQLPQPSSSLSNQIFRSQEVLPSMLEVSHPSLMEPFAGQSRRHVEEISAPPETPAPFAFSAPQADITARPLSKPPRQRWSRRMALLAALALVGGGITLFAVSKEKDGLLATGAPKHPTAAPTHSRSSANRHPSTTKIVTPPLSVVIQSIPTQVMGGNPVPVVVTASRAGVSVALHVTYDTLALATDSPPQITDFAGQTTFSWTPPSPGSHLMVNATVKVTASNAQGQNAQSPLVQVQVLPAGGA